MNAIPTADEIRGAMVQLFKTTTDTRGEAILGALVPHTFDPLRAIWNVPDYEAEELCHFVNQFNAYVRKEQDAPALTRLRVLLYCHVMEAETPPAVIWNLLRLINGEQPSWAFYAPGKKGDQPCDEPEKRFGEIKRVSDQLGQPIGDVLDRLWRNKLRNAFSHAQYTILAGGDFLGSKNISPLTANAVRPSDKADALGENPYYYTASEVEQLYEAALQYLLVFTECYRIGSAPFKDGAFHPIPSGPVRWDKDRGWWSPS